MKVTFFSSKPYDHTAFLEANQTFDYELVFLEPHLSATTARLAADSPVVCAFINDDLSRPVLETLAANGTQIIALRCAGFNNIDLEAAKALSLTVVRVPEYSPHAVAEHAVGLMLMLNRKLYRAYNRVRDDNFSLQGLVGFDLYGKTVGIIGTGKIGACFAKIMWGFGCRLIAYDINENPDCLELGVEYADLPTVLSQADVISLHCPLVADTYHLINRDTLAQMKPGVMLINTGRGGLINAAEAIAAIKSGQLGYLGIDVYEEEQNLFFEDLSDSIIQDDTFQLLQSFPNVVITAHQGFFTKEALHNIAHTTLQNVQAIAQGEACPNQL